MLTVELLRSNAALSALSQEQLEAIVTLSKNDEESVIGKRIGELHGQYDKDILSVTGVEKNGTEKTYDYLKRVLADYKDNSGKVSQLETLLQESKTKLAEYEAKADPQLAQKLKDEKALTARLQAELNTAKALVDTTKADYEAKIKGYKIDAAYDKVFAGLSFRPDISEAVQDALKNAAKAEIAAKGTLDFDEVSRQVILRNSDGEIVRNAANGLNPSTLEELVKSTSIKDVLQVKKVGAGSNPQGKQGAGNAVLLDLSGAKTQIDADKAITNYLTSKGLSVDEEEYWTQLQQIRLDNKVAELPIR